MTSHIPRHELVARIRERFTDRTTPRLQLMFIISVAGVVAFLTSVGALWLGLSSMAIRYPAAVICGYLAFLALIRVWIAWHRTRWHDEAELDASLDLLDAVVPDVDVDIGGPGAGTGFDGGTSGGGGTSGHWETARATRAAVEPRSPDGGSLGIDVDELWPIVLAAVCALGGLAAILYVVYAAPVLLAEVALDAAIVSALYRRLRREDASHWAATAFRHTIVPAAVLVVFAAVLGFALGVMAPDARSIGGVMRAFVE